MQVKIYWVAEIGSGRLGTMARPRGGDWLEDEIQLLRESNVDVVVSLLEPDEARELDLDREEEFCGRNGMAYLSFPIPDYGTPESITQVRNFVTDLSDLLAGGKNMVIHCRQGIGRSSLIAVCVLTTNGLSADEAFEKITAARGRSVPDTEEQRDWVGKYLAMGALDI